MDDKQNRSDRMAAILGQMNKLADKPAPRVRAGPRVVAMRKTLRGLIKGIQEGR